MSKAKRLNERILPPIAFSEDEAISIFFAIQTLRYYISLLFDIEYESIKKKFYLNISEDIRDRIDRIKDHVDFLSVHQQEQMPFLRQLLDEAIQQQVIIINYEINEKTSNRSVQPIGIYANEWKWYCPSYCFLTKDYRVFRCDRIKSVELDGNTDPIDLSNINLKKRFSIINDNKEILELYVELTNKGVEKYQSVKWPNIELNKREDGSRFLKGNILKNDMNFFSDYFITYGKNAIIKKPFELIKCIKENLNIILDQYE